VFETIDYKMENELALSEVRDQNTYADNPHTECDSADNQVTKLVHSSHSSLSSNESAPVKEVNINISTDSETSGRADDLPVHSDKNCSALNCDVGDFDLQQVEKSQIPNYSGSGVDTDTNVNDDASLSLHCNGLLAEKNDRDLGSLTQMLSKFLDNCETMSVSHTVMNEHTLKNIIDSLVSYCKANNFENLLPNISGILDQSSIISDLKTQMDDLSECNKKLECQNLEIRHELKQSVEELSSHDEAAKRTIARLQQDHDNKVKEINKRCAALETDKQIAVMDYARREKELLDLRQKKDAAEQFARTAAKDREKANSQLKSLKLDLSKLKTALDKKEAEVSTCKQEIERLKEEINSQIIKCRWAHNKLKTEVDNHKETKEKCDKLFLEVHQAKEETEQIRQNCQDMIKTYQESEEIKSNALDLELKEKMQLLNERESQSEDLQTLLKQRSEELNLLKIKYKDLFEESAVLKSRVECLDDEKVKNEQIIHGYEEILNKQKQAVSELTEKLSALESIQAELEETATTANALQLKLGDAVREKDTAIVDSKRKEQREQELLEFTKRLSSKNSQLAVQVEELTEKLNKKNTDFDQAEQVITALREEVRHLTAVKQDAVLNSDKALKELNARLEEKEKMVRELMLQIEELNDEMRTLKRKNAASLKDLTRQLNQAKKKLETNDGVVTSSARNSAHQSADGESLGSRTSSTTSLDKMVVVSAADVNCSSQNVLYDPEPVPEARVTGPTTADRQLLIERIVRLQQIHAKKNEKIDFLNEHVRQLVQELQKKQRLIQHYIMREEVGSLAPSKRGDHHNRPGLTLELSMEINQKMQSVLEDTILKNITLKENLETLGKEVQRLCSQGAAS